MFACILMLSSVGLAFVESDRILLKLLSTTFEKQLDGFDMSVPAAVFGAWMVMSCLATRLQVGSTGGKSAQTSVLLLVLLVPLCMFVPTTR